MRIFIDQSQIHEKRLWDFVAEKKNFFQILYTPELFLGVDRYTRLTNPEYKYIYAGRERHPIFHVVSMILQNTEWY